MRTFPSRSAPALAVVVLALSAALLGAAPAVAAPPSPVFGAEIDDYARTGDKTCDPVDKPGVVAFRSMVLAAYRGTGTGGISRDCSYGSDHESGRAWDWPLSADRAADQARAEDLFDWLLAADDYGNPHARARRLGITYLIWDRQIFSVSEYTEWWRPYTGASPHTDHVHVSFSQAGADKLTSWWVPLPERDYAPLPGARGLGRACPDGRVEPGRFADVPSTMAHGTAIDCVAWWRIAEGRPDGNYGPAQGITRAQMAQMLARTLLRSGHELEPDPADAFTDDDHLTTAAQLAINQIAAEGVARGTGEGAYGPDREVTRAQMASFLVTTVERRTGRRLPAGEDYFNDDNNERAHGASIGKAARAGVVGGTGELSYRPSASTTRGQMASFLARTVDLLVEKRRASLPVS